VETVELVLHQLTAVLLSPTQAAVAVVVRVIQFQVQEQTAAETVQLTSHQQELQELQTVAVVAVAHVQQVTLVVQVVQVLLLLDTQYKGE
jgi:hypothetical protein